MDIFLLTLVKVHFKKINGFCRFFTFQIQKKTKVARLVQLASLRKNTSELFFFHTDPWAEKLHITEKIPHECAKIYGQGRLWPFSVGCFKSYSGVLAFGIFTEISTSLKEQS